VLAACADQLSADWNERLAEGLFRLIGQGNHRPLAAWVSKLSDRLRQILDATVTANGQFAPTDAQLQAFAMIGAEILQRSAAAVSAVVPVILALLRRQAGNRNAFLTAL